MTLNEEIREQHEKVRRQGWKARLRYFLSYYKIPTIVVLVLIIGLGWFIRDMVLRKEIVYHAVFLNAGGEPGAGAADREKVLEQSFLTAAGIDPGKYDCRFETEAVLDLENFNEMSLAISQRIAGLAAAKELDALLADPMVFSMYAEEDAFLDLREILAAETLATLEGDGRILERDGIPVGIRIGDAPCIRDSGFYQKGGGLLGFTTATQRADRADAFVRWMLS